MPIKLNGATSGSVTLSAPAVAGTSELVLPTGTIDLSAAWTAYTPTLTNATLGNGTVAGRYLQVGKTVIVRATFTLGSTSAVGTDPTMTLPVTATSTGYTNGATPIGQATLIDSGTANVVGLVVMNSTTTALVARAGISGSAAFVSSITATAPFTWTTNDAITAQFTYEAA